jgi:hypothetical protein
MAPWPINFTAKMVVICGKTLVSTMGRKAASFSKYVHDRPGQLLGIMAHQLAVLQHVRPDQPDPHPV